MSVVRRRNDLVEAFEHAMQGVRTYDSHRVESRGWDPGVIGTRSDARVETMGDTPVEHEVTIRMRRLPKRERTR
jgi:hypothetical protein